MSTRDEDTLVYTPAAQFADTFFVPAEQALPVTFGAATHQGHVRSRNEDQFAVLRQRRSTDILLTSLEPGLLSRPEACTYSFVVADGMGGMKSGDYASQLAVETMLELSGQASSWVMRLRDFDAQQIRQRAAAYVQRINAALQEQSQSDPSKRDMGTTWTSAHLVGPSVIIVHLGDSRAYLFRAGRLERMTRDQTMAQDLIDVGMEPDSVRKFSHVLTNSLGGGNESASAAVQHVPLKPGDQLLLCTDGLTDMLSDAAIAAELGRQPVPQSICDALVQRALEHGGKDNITVVLAAIGSAGD